MHECLESIIAQRLEKKHLGLSPGLARTDQPCAKDAGGVERESVAGCDESHEIREVVVLDRPGRTIHHHQAAPIATLGRRLRDAVPRKVELVVRGKGAEFTASSHPEER